MTFREGDQVGWVSFASPVQFEGTVVDPQAGDQIAVLWHRGYPTGYLGIHDPEQLKHLATHEGGRA